MEYTPKSWLEKDGNMIIDPLGFGVPMGSLFLDTANSVGKQQQLAIQFPQLTYIYIYIDPAKQGGCWKTAVLQDSFSTLLDGMVYCDDI